MSLYEYERTKSALAEEQRKNKELARRIENTEEAKLNALHDLIDRLQGALPRESSGDDEDSEGRLIPYTVKLSVEERLRGAIEYTKRRDEALVEIAKIIAPEDEVVGSGDRLVAPTISRIPTPREIQDFERRTKAEIAAVRRQSRVDQAELLKVQEALVETGMPAGVTYRTWIAELQRKIDTLRKDTEHASEVFTGIREVIGPEPAIVEWVREAREKIDTAPPANTAREDRSAICELGNLILSGTKDCYAASAVVKMVKHLLKSPAVIAALKEASETSWEWVLGGVWPQGVPNKNGRSYASVPADAPTPPDWQKEKSAAVRDLPSPDGHAYSYIVYDDTVQHPPKPVPVEMIDKAWNWFKDRERMLGHKIVPGAPPKFADGRARWRNMAIRGLHVCRKWSGPRWMRAAYLAAKAAPPRGPSPLIGAYPAWAASKIV